jgi:hypothetical protein
LYIAFKIILLEVVEEVAGSVEKHNGSVFGQGIFIKIIGIFGGIYLKSVLSSQLVNGLYAIGYGGMAIAGGLRENEYPGFSGSGSAAGK